MSEKNLREMSELIKKALDEGLSFKEVANSLLEALIKEIKAEKPYLTKEEAEQEANSFLKRKIREMGFLHDIS